MEHPVGRYWLFALLCSVLAALILRLIARERVTLQGSLAYLFLLAGLAVAALFPGLDEKLAQAMGFTLVANWFFAVSLAGFSFLHLAALVQLSRVELRSIALTQQVGILQERLDRLQPGGGPREA
jgi:Uncharacterized conserved protein (DUF2304)